MYDMSGYIEVTELGFGSGKKCCKQDVGSLMSQKKLRERISPLSAGNIFCLFVLFACQHDKTRTVSDISMKFLWQTGMIKSSNAFVNGCVPTHW